MTDSVRDGRSMRLGAILLCAAMVVMAMLVERSASSPQAQSKAEDAKANAAGAADSDKDIARVREVLAKLRGSVISIRVGADEEMPISELFHAMQHASGIGMAFGPDLDRHGVIAGFEFTPAMGSVAECLDLVCALRGLAWRVVGGYVLIHDSDYGRSPLGQITRAYDVLALVDHLASREAALIAAVRKTAGDSGNVRSPDGDYDDSDRPMELAEMIIDRAADKVLTSLMTAISREDDEYPSLGRDGLLVLRLPASDHIRVADAIAELHRTLKLPMGER